MDSKELAAVALIIVLLGAAYYLTNASSPPLPEGEDEYAVPFLSEDNTTIGEFAQKLFLAQKVAIVEDLRDLDAYPLSRNNVMQCAVDFSGSEGLVGKELYVYALEGEACTTNDGVKTIGECYSEIVMLMADSSASVIWIEKGDESIAYSANLIVRVNEQYSQGDCSATFSVPQNQYPAEGNETNAEGANQSSEGGEQGAPAQMGQNETLPGAEGANNETLPEEFPGNETPEGELPDANASENSSDSVTFG